VSRRLAGRLAVVSAVALCFVAQLLFTGEVLTREHDTNPASMAPHQAVGLVLLGLAVGLAALSDSRETDPSPPATPDLADPSFVRRMLVPVLLSLLLALASLVAVSAGRETFVVRAAWVTGMLLFFVPLAWVSKGTLAAPRVPWTDTLAVAALTAAGFWLRYVRLTELPNDVHPDVALMGRVTMDLMRRGDSRWFGLAESDHPLSTHQILAFGMRLFGTNHYGLVMLSVIAGTVTLPIVFLLGRELFGRTAALLGTAVLTLNYTHIHFSRTLFGPIATLVVTLGVYLLVRGLATGVPAHYGFAGGLLAAAMFTYYSARISPLLAGAVFLVEVARGRVRGRAGAARWGAFVAGTFVVFAPMLGFAIREPRAFVGRGNSVSLLDPEVLRHSMQKYDADDIVEVVIEQTRRTMLGLHVFGDQSPHFGFPRPAVGAATAALFALGIGFSFRRLRETPVALLWAWQTLTLLLGGILTSDPPYWPHLNILLPVVAILAGLGGARVASALAGEQAGWQTAAAVLVGGFIVASGVHGWHVYNEFESNNAEPAMRASRYLDGLPRDTRVFLVSSPDDWDDDVFRFFNQGLKGQDETVDSLLRPDLRIEPPAVILLRDPLSALARIKERYPGGRVRELRQPGRPKPVFVAYELLSPPPAAH
jgi:4-amino-4-deoxy-L-arabinose transferase-like glycosyltransferase